MPTSASGVISRSRSLTTCSTTGRLVSSEDNSTESSDNGLIKTGSTNNASHSNVLNMSMPVRVIVIVVMIAAAVGIYYYIAGKIRKSRKK